MATYIADINAHSVPMVDANEYYVDHFDNTLTIFQTIRPENLQFVGNIRAPDTITYDISLSAKDLAGGNVVFRNPIDNTSFIGPQRTGWVLRQGYDPISAGLHSKLNGTKGSEFMSVGGEDWLAYFARRQFPYNGDPAHLFDEAIGGAPMGLAYQATDIDQATVLTNILDAVLAKTGSWPITYTLSTTGKTVRFEIPIGDQTYISNFISVLADISPGFDYEITWDMEFVIAAPYFWGDPTTFDITDPTESAWSYVFDDSDDAHTPYALDFSNSGPTATHVSGYGGNSPQMAVTLGYAAGITQFHRLDASYDFAEIYNRGTLDSLTRKNLAFGLQPQHEIPVSVLPSQIANFWTIFKPGRAIYLDQDLEFHEIQSGHRIISITAGDENNEGEPVVSLGLNQIYDLSETIGTVEG